MTTPNDKRSSGNANEATRSTSAVDPTGGGNLDKVRDILFGGQAREFDRRFSRLEERFSKEISDLKDESRRRFEALEQFVNKEIESLMDRIKTEQSDRSDSVKELAGELKETAKAIEKRISQLDDQTNKAHRDIRQQIHDLSKTMSDEIRQKTDELADALDREAERLQNDKTDRSALAALLTEVAMRLNNEFNLPLDE